MEHSFDIEVAVEVGVNAAILYKNIQFWCAKNKANEKHFYDGHFWTYNSRRAFSELMPYFTERQVEYALNKLVDSGYIIKGNYNKSPYDKTQWYADIKSEITDNEYASIERTKLCNQKTENVRPIPYNKQQIKNINNNIYSENITTQSLTENTTTDLETNNTKRSDVLAYTKNKFQSSAPEHKFGEFDFGNTKPKRMNLYDKCVSYIYEWCSDSETQKLLIQYLDLCVEMKSLRGFNQWKGMLNTLEKVQLQCEPHTYDEIIKMSIDYGWKTFYPIKEFSSKSKKPQSTISDADYKSVTKVDVSKNKTNGREF